MRTVALLATCALVTVTATTRAAEVLVDLELERRPISPYIYGANQVDGSSVRFTAYRMGGNRLTGYNWESGVSSAGSDWEHSSDTYLCGVSGLSEAACAQPGAVAAAFVDAAQAAGAYSLLTLQMAGYVSADAEGTVTEAETAPSPRWYEVLGAKGGAFAAEPDPNDGVVYMDELVSFLVERYGSAADGGVLGYALDNEPDLWSSTHPRIHPDPTGARELVDRSVALAAAVKAVDPSAEIFGFVSYGYAGFTELQSAPDWPTVRGSYEWYTEYFLAEMAAASATAGTRLLDVLDLHFYSEARQNDVRVQEGTAENAGARVQATRSLWDRSYDYSETDPTTGENSWITEWNDAIALIPRVLEQIERYYPGTRFALTEYDFGAKDHPSGGIAQADALGIFGREGVYLATRWGEPGTYTDAAYRLYLDYDGEGSQFGTTRVRAQSSDIVNVPAYAAANGTNLHLVLINRHLTESQPTAVSIAGDTVFASGAAWGFDADSPNLTARGEVVVADNAFDFELPPLSAIHVVLPTAGGEALGEGGASGSGSATGGNHPTGSGGAAASEAGGSAATGAVSPNGEGPATAATGDSPPSDGSDGEGCGCHAACRPGTASAGLAVLALALLAFRRRAYGEKWLIPTAG